MKTSDYFIGVCVIFSDVFLCDEAFKHDEAVDFSIK